MSVAAAGGTGGGSVSHDRAGCSSTTLPEGSGRVTIHGRAGALLHDRHGPAASHRGVRVDSAAVTSMVPHLQRERRS
jgi:hypothetical protein